MDRLMWRAALFVVLCVAAAGCSSDNTSSTTPSTLPTTITETFAGTLSRNGAVSYSFTILASGTVTATLTGLDGDAPPRIGLGLGTYDTNQTACSPSNGKFNDSATKSTSVAVSALSAGTLCVRVYDSTGTLDGPVDYEVSVVHP